MAMAQEDIPVTAFRVAVNRQVVNKSKDFEVLATGFQNYLLTQKQLADEINLGHAFTTQHEGRRLQENFTAAQHIALDFDKASREQMEEILADEVVKNYYGIFYHTPSSTPEQPKFRIIFQLQQPVEVAGAYRKLVEAFIWRFSATADGSCKDPCRLFYGSQGSNPVVTGRVIPNQEVGQILAAYERDQQYEENLRTQARKVTGSFSSDNLSQESKKRIFDRILESHCIRVRSADPGTRHDTLLRSARALGGYIYGEPEATDEYEVRRRLEEAYTSHSNVNRREMQKTIDAGLRYGERSPINIESLVQPTSTPAPEAAVAEAPPAGKKLLWRLSELSAYPKPDWLLYGIFKKNSLAFLVGPPKCGKSFYALDLALQVAATGKKVLYIAAEDPGDFEVRGRAWCHYNNVDPAIVENNIIFYSEPIQLHDDNKRAEFLALLAAEGFIPDLIVVDTLAMNSMGLDENNQKDMGIFINALIQLRLATGACILTIHHTNRAGTYRGSSVLPSSADTFILAQQEGDKLWKGGQLKIIFELQKNSAPIEDKHLRGVPYEGTLVLVDEASHNAVYAPKTLTDYEKEILRVCCSAEAQNGISVSGIQKLAGWEEESKRTGAYKACKDLGEGGWLEIITMQKITNTRYLYKITPKGRDMVERLDLRF